MEDKKLFWGDFHKHLQDLDDPDRIIKSARDNIDFYPLLCYPFVWFLQSSTGEKEYLGQPTNLSDAFPEAEESSRLLVESTGHRSEYDLWWKKIKKKVRQYNDPGNFVTLLGYEWHGNRRRYGDNNVIYFGDEGELDPEEKLPDLYANHKGERTLIIPHHIGYKRGRRGKDWDVFDEKLSPVAEIFSYHGSSETEPGLRSLNNNPSMGPGVSESLWQEGLDRGYRVGAIASNDGPGLPGGYGNGLAAIWADSLTRKSLYESLMDRRVYAVTGDKIELSYYVNGEPMGSVLSNEDRVEVDFSARAPSALDRVELILNGERVRVYEHLEKSPVIKEDRFAVRVDFGWGPATHYGISEEGLDWKGELAVSDGILEDVNTCFTIVGQKLDWSSKCARWQLSSRRQGNELNSELRQSIIFKLKGGPKTELYFQGNGYKFSRKIKDLAEGSDLIALEDRARELVERDTSISAEKVMNPDVFYFISPKIKLHKASGGAERRAEGSFTVKDELKPGRNYLYLRVLEKNGQMAWSSPIWIDR
ncbi:MAG: DUF3604 domain-containing protein [Candidatus Bipolaricaulota bacterium]